ncbi:hypothetical protein [Nitrosopumilus sp.]|uniref:hypothetical protein n=1 Tax=Nitrosopumilus sp. TaxID=2024843 RepID=UPI002632979A|nr:hypothetical protein [Nitrosopumilus sp.]
MTVKKAIKMLDWWIDQRKQAMEHFKKNWNYKTEVEDVAKAILTYDETVISNLQKIRAELVPKCKHPKKMIDTLPDGQKYCMNCNMDL